MDLILDSLGLQTTIYSNWLKKKGFTTGFRVLIEFLERLMKFFVAHISSMNPDGDTGQNPKQHCPVRNRTNI
jgi:hypothetical protein